MKKFFGVGTFGCLVLAMAVAICTPACRRAESCKTRCERLTRECNPSASVADCPAVCEAQDDAFGGACGGPFRAYIDCIESLSKAERCDDGGSAECNAQIEDVLICCSSTPNAVGCDTGECAIDGQSCQFNSDCCENFCASDGFCGCIPTQATGCATNMDCCSGACDMSAGLCI